MADERKTFTELLDKLIFVELVRKLSQLLLQNLTS
jgi:low temperature requirement protein LtrA